MQAQRQHPMEQPRYYFKPPYIEGQVVIGLEHIADMEDEIRVLHEAHFNETETEYLDADFEPDYAQYKALENDGRFVCFTVRIGGQMVAYLQYYIFRDLHTQQIQNAREDAFFVHALARSKKVGGNLLAYAEGALTQLGCRYIGMTSKAPIGAPDIGPFLEKRNYRPVAIYYTKKLEK